VPVRERFLTQLEQTLHARLPLSVIVVMRNDFRPILSQYLPPSLLETWWKAGNTLPLPTTLERDALNDIVREPAAAVGLAFQHGLIETIVDNAIEIAPTRGERGRVAQSTVLPLLEHALHTLWQRRTEGFLTHEAYHAIGELTGALPQLAEAAFTQLSTEEQLLARHVLMQLVQVGDTSLGISDTRQRRFLADLSPSAELRDNTHQVIEKLTTSRLVVTSVEHNQTTVELMHGVLLDWPRFQQWLSDDRPFLLWKQRLQFALDEWKRTARDKAQGGLLRGALLEEAEQWLRERSDNLSADEQRFVHESLVLRKAEEKEKEAQRKLEMEAHYQQRELEAAQKLAQEAEQRRKAEAQARQEAEIRAIEQATAARRLRLGLFFLLGALLVAAVLGVKTWQLLTESRVQTRKTFAKQLAFQADLVRNQSPVLLERSKLIAIEAMRRFPSLEAHQALRVEFTLLQRASMRLPHENSVYHVTFSPDGSRLATASADKTARLWVWRPEDMIATTCSRLNRNLTRAEWRQYLGNEPYHKTCADLPIGTGFLDEGKQLAKDGKGQDALAVYAQARQIDPTLNISAVDWNLLCWFGSLSGQATAIMKACQQAVSLNPEDGNIRDSRGLARALAGDTKGAIEDFSFFVEWTKKTGKQADLREQREQWVTALTAGKNPFDAETLKKLREH
jgi:tetratricopeptide (TPR) repeat protein